MGKDSRRGGLQMRTLQLVAFAALLVGCEPQPTPSNNVPPPPPVRDTLEKFLGRDLRKLSQDEQHDLRAKLASDLIELRLTKEHSIPYDFKPWFIWKYEPAPGRSGYILFHGRPANVVPGNSGAAVDFFDEDGVLINSTDFLTGWRITIDSALFHFDVSMNAYVIEVASGNYINGRDIERQCYGVIDGRIALLRLEDSEGKVVGRHFRSSKFTIGPDVPLQTPEQWERVLISNRKADVLEALAWLAAGAHLHRVARDQDKESADLVEEVLQRPAVRVALEELVRSDHPWISEAAKMVLSPPRD
jgi:hypothetical protein